MKLVTTAQMRELERRSVEAGTSIEQLMENAGLAVAQEVWMHLGVVQDRRVLVLVGPGNNGGDGLVAARHLHDWGAQVHCYLLTPRDEAADANWRQLLERDVTAVTAMEDAQAGFQELKAFLAETELVVDALLGTGPRRPIEVSSPLAVVLNELRLVRQRPGALRLLAVDLPTGVDADTGAADPHAVPCDATVSLGHSKVGVHLYPAAGLVGREQVVEIGLAPPEGELPFELMTLRGTRERLPARPPDSHKGSFGWVLAVAGSLHYVGAAYLACSGAMRAGAGLVTLACPRAIYPLAAAKLTESTFLPLSDQDGHVTATAVPEVLAALEPYRVLLLGCGLGQSEGTLAFVRDLLHAVRGTRARPLVIDADGLNNLALWPRWWGQLEAPCILTPHPGELSRLTGRPVPEILADRLGASLEAAQRFRHVVVLKGAHSVVAAPDGRARVSPFANAGLASAGTGDVLAGVIAGLLAQGLALFDAASVGVYLHGAAGELLRGELGDAGVLAGDLLTALPKARKEILAP